MSEKEVAGIKSNLLVFPHKETHVDLQDSNRAIANAIEIRQNFCEDISEIVSEQMMGWLNAYGVFRNPDKVNILDITMIETAITAALYRYYDIEHPLHEVTDKVIEMVDSVEDLEENQTEESSTED